MEVSQRDLRLRVHKTDAQPTDCVLDERQRKVAERPRRGELILHDGALGRAPYRQGGADASKAHAGSERQEEEQEVQSDEEMEVQAAVSKDQKDLQAFVNGNLSQSHESAKFIGSSAHESAKDFAASQDLSRSINGFCVEI